MVVDTNSWLYNSIIKGPSIIGYLNEDIAPRSTSSDRKSPLGFNGKTKTTSCWIREIAPAQASLRENIFNKKRLFLKFF